MIATVTAVDTAMLDGVSRVQLERSHRGQSERIGGYALYLAGICFVPNDVRSPDKPQEVP